MTQSNRLPLCIGIFLFISGFCSLAYQVVWLREFRLLFGGSTAAASAVLAVFMGAIGVGSYVLGRKVDQSKTPARLYSFIEAIIAVSVLISPALLVLAQKTYYSTGGMQQLGIWATVLQIGITILVLGIPCFFMGGTLPAAVRILQNNEDENRKSTALLYGINIAGAVTGAFTVNFHFLEIFGNTFTLIAAGCINLLLGAIVYFSLGKNESPRKLEETNQQEHSAPNTGLYTLAFLSGLIFFIIEIVWFRTSIPLLGGSVYNFGLILVIALLGMSIGGACCSLLLKFYKPSYSLLTLITSLFALSLALPYLTGDTFAHFCTILQNGYISYPFSEKIAIWFIIGCYLVFPTSFMAGLQFPMIIALLGKGKTAIGEQIGKLYGFNTAGAVIGSLIGGFIMIPKLSIPTTWLYLIIIASSVAVCTFIYSVYSKETNSKLSRSLSIASIALTTTWLFSSSGLTGYWQQNPIGFGRSLLTPKESKITTITRQRNLKRSLIYNYDGKELSGALAATSDLGLLSNGKSDGSAISDAGTQVMLTLLGSLLHPEQVKEACVIGLGTGTSAGWLAQDPAVEQIDVMELEPHLIECAKYYTPVNFDVLNSPKTNIIIGDARETLLSSEKKYDLIASEPSNPQRAGVANLYTSEFYQCAASRLNENGIFTQWLQAYEIDMLSIRLILTTLKSVFPEVDVYQTLGGDLVYVCRLTNTPVNTEILGNKLNSHPYNLGALYTWGTNSVEGIMTHAIANNAHVTHLCSDFPFINTDNLNKLEFSLGKTGGSTIAYNVIDQLYLGATTNKQVLPNMIGPFDINRYTLELAGQTIALHRSIENVKKSEWFNSSATFQRHSILTTLNNKLQQDTNYPFTPSNLMEATLWANSLAQTGDSRALAASESIKSIFPIDYHAIRNTYYTSKDMLKEADNETLNILTNLKNSPWCRSSIIKAALTNLHTSISDNSRLKNHRNTLHELLRTPFSNNMWNTDRLNMLWSNSQHLKPKQQLTAALSLEPHFPFDPDMLKTRLELYQQTNHPFTQQAEEDLKLYQSLHN